MIPVRHPDMIEGLAEDCRRSLREEYAIIEARSQATSPEAVRARVVNSRVEYIDARGNLQSRQETPAEARAHIDAERGTVGAAIAQYRRVAKLWGVDVG